MFWGTYGAVLFRCINSPKKVQDSLAWRLPRHQLVGRYPVIEHMGPEVRRMTLTIDLLRRFTLPLTPDIVLGMLKGYADRGQAQVLIIGLQYIGDFAIERLDSEVLASDTLGLTRHRRITMELLEVCS